MSESSGAYSSQSAWGAVLGALFYALLSGAYHTIKGALTKDKPTNQSKSIVLPVNVRRFVDYIGDRTAIDQSSYFVFYAPPNQVSERQKFSLSPNLTDPPAKFMSYNNNSAPFRNSKSIDFDTHYFADTTASKLIKSLSTFRIHLLKEGQPSV